MLKGTVHVFFEEEHNDISGLYYKSFRIVIYNQNDSTIVEPVL